MELLVVVPWRSCHGSIKSRPGSQEKVAGRLRNLGAVVSALIFLAALDDLEPLQQSGQAVSFTVTAVLTWVYLDQLEVQLVSVADYLLLGDVCLMLLVVGDKGLQNQEAPG
jgi:hypothetical protein